MILGQQHLAILPLQKIKKIIDLIRPFKAQGTLYECCDCRIHKAYFLNKFCKNHQIPLNYVVAFDDTILMESGINVCIKNGSEDIVALANFIRTCPCDVIGWVHFVMDHIPMKDRCYK